MRCKHCRINVAQLKHVDASRSEWLHVEPGDPPYRQCKPHTSFAEPDIKRWAAVQYIIVKIRKQNDRKE